MTTGIDSRGAERAARARALAASIVDAPRVPRQLVVADRTGLRPSSRRRRSAPPTPLPLVQTPSRRRLIALGVFVVQLLALGALFVLPPFRLATVEVSGATLLRRDLVLRTAGIAPGQSIFSIDGEAARTRLERLPWVRRATVETALPATVHITIVEWAPVLRLHGSGGERLVAPSGATLDVASVTPRAVPPVPLLVDLRPTPTAVDPLLARTLGAVAQGFPQVVGCPVARFEWQSDGRLVVVATPGWRAVLGYVDLPAEIGAIPRQIAALGALRARLDLLHPSFGYVDLSDPQAPAVGGTPGH